MKNINDLAYSNLIVQTKHLAKDKKQKNRYHQSKLPKNAPIEDGQNSTDIPEVELETLDIIEEENNRRKGSDRRKSQQNRGRYVESRLNKNRRYNEFISKE